MAVQELQILGCLNSLDYQKAKYVAEVIDGLLQYYYQGFLSAAYMILFNNIFIYV